MAPINIKPDAKLQVKLFIIVALIAVLSLGGIFVLTWAIAADNDVDNPIGVAGLVTGLINAVWLIPAVLIIPPFFRSLQYEIHDDEVIVRVGVITKSVKHVPFRTMTNIEVKQGPFDRLFAIGTVNIQTAGMSGQQGAEESLIGLTNFQEVYERVAEAVRRYRGAMAPDQAGEELASAAAGDQVLASILSEVQAIRRALERQP
jgi:membrane protein YdbS with pleckstrin-like domain